MPTRALPVVNTTVRLVPVTRGGPAATIHSAVRSAGQFRDWSWSPGGSGLVDPDALLFARTTTPALGGIVATQIGSIYYAHAACKVTTGKDTDSTRLTREATWTNNSSLKSSSA